MNLMITQMNVVMSLLQHFSTQQVKSLKLTLVIHHTWMDAQLQGCKGQGIQMHDSSSRLRMWMDLDQ
jgi:hypothetical protein